MRATALASFLALYLVTVHFASAQGIEVFSPRPSRIIEGTNTSQARFYPDEMEVAAVGDYSVLIAIGKEGVAVGGGLLVDFPKAWFTNPLPLIKPVQMDDPAAPHYMECKTYRGGARLDRAIDHLNFEGSRERFRHVVQLTVRDHALFEGDTVRVTFKNTTSPIVSGADTVRVAVDAAGTGEFKLASGAPYHVRPGLAASALIVAPSDVVVSEPTEIHVALFDSLGNASEGFAGDLEVAVDTQRMPVTFGPGRAVAKLSWTPSRTGFAFPQLSGALQAFGGPVRVHASMPAQRLFWGDLHSHSDNSKDGIGHAPYAFARDVTRLDFFGSSEHGIDDGGGDSISPDEWQRNIETVERFYEAGRFVTLLGYECSLPNGHHNVYYRGISGMPWPEHRVRTVERLWELLDANDAVTIPHHLGIQWGMNNRPIDGPGLQPILTGGGAGGPKLDWSREHDPTLRPILEIYSAHGQSEYFNRNDPLAYEGVRYTGARSGDGPHYAQDAWAAGLPMGVIASSDDHQAHPGLSHNGLAAVFAPELTRDTIFDAIRARHCYGTTGARILLEFSAGGTQMGGEATASGDVNGRVLVAAPSDIAFAEVLAFTGGDAWNTVARWDDPGRVVDQTFQFTVKNETTLYLRAELKDPVNGRIARAWSSPIWLRTAE